MKKREVARKMVQKVENSQKQVWNEKYRKLRNVVKAKIRKENYDHNNNKTLCAAKRHIKTYTRQYKLLIIVLLGD